MRTLIIAAAIGGIAACSSSPYTTYGAWDDPTAWQPDPTTGCLIDQYYVQRLDVGELNWEGFCVNGYAIGYGTLSWTEPDGSRGFWQTCLHPEHSQSNCSTGGGARGG